MVRATLLTIKNGEMACNFVDGRVISGHLSRNESISIPHHVNSRRSRVSLANAFAVGVGDEQVTGLSMATPKGEFKAKSVGGSPSLPRNEGIGRIRGALILSFSIWRHG